MSATVNELLKSAMELTETDRLFLATRLLETVSEDLPGWSIDAADLPLELQSRASDGTPGISWEKVQSQLDADLKS